MRIFKPGLGIIPYCIGGNPNPMHTFNHSKGTMEKRVSGMLPATLVEIHQRLNEVGYRKLTRTAVKGILERVGAEEEGIWREK